MTQMAFREPGGGWWEGEVGVICHRTGCVSTHKNLPNWNSQLQVSSKRVEAWSWCLSVPLLLYCMVIWLKDVYSTHTYTYTHTPQ
jgi:hypothetical protein